MGPTLRETRCFVRSYREDEWNLSFKLHQDWEQVLASSGVGRIKGDKSPQRNWTNWIYIQVSEKERRIQNVKLGPALPVRLILCCEWVRNGRFPRRVRTSRLRLATLVNNMLSRVLLLGTTHSWDVFRGFTVQVCLMKWSLSTHSAVKLPRKTTYTATISTCIDQDDGSFSMSRVHCKVKWCISCDTKSKIVRCSVMSIAVKIYRADHQYWGAICSTASKSSIRDGWSLQNLW